MGVLMVYFSVIALAYIRNNPKFDGAMENWVTILIGLSWVLYVLFNVLF